MNPKTAISNKRLRDLDIALAAIETPFRIWYNSSVEDSRLLSKTLVLELVNRAKDICIEFLQGSLE